MAGCPFDSQKSISKAKLEFIRGCLQPGWLQMPHLVITPCQNPTWLLVQTFSATTLTVEELFHGGTIQQFD